MRGILGPILERDAIKLLTRIYGGKRLPLGYEDDVAAVPISPRLWIIVKGDMLVRSTDIPPGMTLSEAGRKSIVSTVSDFAAKGVRPKALIVSIGLPRSISKRQLSEIGRGLAEGAAEYGCPIVGGDTNESKDIVIDVAGFGYTKTGELVSRRGAQSGNIVAVTGEFGNSAAGLRMLLRKERHRREAASPVLENAVRRPVARLEEGIRLAKTRAVTSSIDSSDGLAWSLSELARLGHVRIELYSVPVSMEATEYALKHDLSPYDLALYGGEEYELVVTVKRGGWPAALKAVPSLIPIGKVTRGTGVFARIGGRRVRVEPRGWEHFGGRARPLSISR
jgi:thiamine-monophosphate kinase